MALIETFNKECYSEVTYDFNPLKICRELSSLYKVTNTQLFPKIQLSQRFRNGISNPISYGVSDSVAPMGGLRGPPRYF